MKTSECSELKDRGSGCLFVQLDQTVYERCNRKLYPYVEAQYERAEDTSPVTRM